MSQTCRICSTIGGHQSYRVRERMFGIEEEFDYFQCHNCGCLQIEHPPADMSRFYPPHYYSFGLESAPVGGLKSWLGAQRDWAATTGHGILGRFVARWKPPRPDVECLGRIPLRREDRILDVGCGRGQLLSILHRAGFRNLLGVDPFLATDVEVLPGLRVLKRAMAEVDQTFDLIMLHHVFEHIADGLDVLTLCRQRLAPNGKILLRIPTVDSEAWEHYKVHWVQLDAPRHLYLHSRESLKRLATHAGLHIKDVWCDSGAFQFWASEIYRKDIPLVGAQARFTSPTDHFSPEEMRGFDAKAVALNRVGRGDQLVALLSSN